MCVPTCDKRTVDYVSSLLSQIRIAALNAASETADEHEDHFRSAKPSQTKEAQASRFILTVILVMMQSDALEPCINSVFLS